MKTKAQTLLATFYNGGLGIFLSIFFLSSCDRFEQLGGGGLKGLFSKKSKSVEEEPPITAEEQAMNQMLENPDIFAQPEEEAEPEAVFELNKSVQVSLLCYHDFTRVRRMTRDMVLHVDDLRTQMKALADAEISVIPMSDFLAWKRGEKNIPDPSVVITLDDGWEAVYSVAYPVFKEFGYPFTIYLYQNYVEIGGRSLSRAKIMEMVKNGAEVGSHSITHRDLTKVGKRSPEKYQKFLRHEMEQSAIFLKDFLGVDTPTFAYPYGSYSEEVLKMGEELGYEAMVTVNGQKATWDTPSGEVGRFVIHGKDMGNFRIATSFRGRANSTDTVLLSPSSDDEVFKVTTHPEPGESVTERMPELSVDVSQLVGVVPESIVMQVSGIGKVLPHYNEQDGVIRYQLRQPLRGKECLVQVQLRQEAEAKPRLIPWKFLINREALYFSGSESFREKESTAP